MITQICKPVQLQQSMSTVQFVAPGRPVAQQDGGGGGGGGGRGRCGRGRGRRQQDSTRGACDKVLRNSQIMACRNPNALQWVHQNTFGDFAVWA